MRDKPKCHQQPHRRQNGENCQPILASPPEGEQETHAQYETHHFRRYDVEAAEDKQRADQRGAQVPRGKGDCRLAADDVRDAAFVWVERYALNAAAGQDGSDGMAEFVEGNDEHLSISYEHLSLPWIN